MLFDGQELKVVDDLFRLYSLDVRHFVEALHFRRCLGTTNMLAVIELRHKTPSFPFCVSKKGKETLTAITTIKEIVDNRYPKSIDGDKVS